MKQTETWRACDRLSRRARVKTNENRIRLDPRP
jgi:hypothetical protein